MAQAREFDWLDEYILQQSSIHAMALAPPQLGSKRSWRDVEAEEEATRASQLLIIQAQLDFMELAMTAMEEPLERLVEAAEEEANREKRPYNWR
jgi:type II secretory pathway pseudopilin PulG